MRLQGILTFVLGIGFCGLCVALAIANANNASGFNGTWTLIPSRSDFGGQQPIQAGTVKIEVQPNNVYISRDFRYGDKGETESYNFNPDAGKVIRIRYGQVFKTKGEWDGDSIKVSNKEKHSKEVERYTLDSDGILKLVINSPDEQPVTLFFQRQ